MPELDDAATSSAGPEEVWKLLYDPSRFPSWWVGMDTVHDGDDRGGDADFTYYDKDWPDFPMPQRIASSSADRRVTVSCMLSDISIAWTLAARDDGGTDIAVHAVIPEEEAARTTGVAEMLAASVRRLAELAARPTPTA